MEKYKVGYTYPIQELRNYVESHTELYADLGRPNQVAIRNSMDVVAEFYLEGETAKCIFNVYDETM